MEKETWGKGVWGCNPQTGQVRVRLVMSERDVGGGANQGIGGGEKIRAHVCKEQMVPLIAFYF